MANRTVVLTDADQRVIRTMCEEALRQAELLMHDYREAARQGYASQDLPLAYDEIQMLRSKCTGDAVVLKGRT